MPKPAHKKHKKKLKTNNFKLGAVVLVILISLVVMGKVISAIASLGQPYNPDVPENKVYSWDNKSTLNLAIKADRSYVLSFNPLKKEAVIFKIPPNTYLSVPFGFGNWSIDSVYGLGQSETPPKGAKLFKETLSQNLGLPILGYIIFKEENNNFEKIVESWRSNPLIALGTLWEIKTNLSLKEYLQLVLGLRGVRFDKLQVIDLESSSLSSWSLRADGSRVLSLNQAKLDQFMQKQLEESRLKDEGLSIGIYNTTSYPSLAEKAARIISNMGGRVTFTANSPKLLLRSAVLGTTSYSLSYLSQNFVLPCPKRSICPKDSDLSTSRADINIFLGEDYFLEHLGGK